jgi:hypothetical protein
MEKHNNNLQRFVKNVTGAVGIALVAIILVVIAGMTALYYFDKDNRLTISKDDKISLSPTQITAIEQIGEWEFLSVNTEELIDTVKHGFFGDSELVRIYYGTLRLGLNLHELGPHWLSEDGDTLRCTLPQVKLLDQDFIDEARTQSFYESGSWSDADRETLYNRAYERMKARCLTAANIATAQVNAQEQFTRLLNSMGHEKVKIDFSGETVKARPH